MKAYAVVAGIVAALALAGRAAALAGLGPDPGEGPAGPALGPWAMERMLFPYPSLDPASESGLRRAVLHAHARGPIRRNLRKLTSLPARVVDLVDNGVHAMRARLDMLERRVGGFERLMEALGAVEPATDLDTLSLDTVSLETEPYYADLVLPHDPLWAAPAATIRGPSIETFVKLTAVGFLAAVLLVPAGCSYAAGAIYGHARDGPP